MKGIFQRKRRFDSEKINQGVWVILIIIIFIFCISLVNTFISKKGFTQNPAIEKAYP
jgi:hypothetical protein